MNTQKTMHLLVIATFGQSVEPFLRIGSNSSDEPPLLQLNLDAYPFYLDGLN